MFGRNATGGAVRVITRGVSQENEGYISAEYGKYNRMVMTGVANARLSDTFGIRVVAGREQRDGIARNINPTGLGLRRLNDIGNTNLSLKAAWDPSDSLQVRFGVRYLNNADTYGTATTDIAAKDGLSVSVNNGFVTGNSPYTTSTTVPAVNTMSSVAANLDIDLDLGAVQLSSTTVYGNSETYGVGDTDGTNARISDVSVPGFSETISQEFQLKSNGNTALNWVLGLYGFYEHAGHEVTLDRGGAKNVSVGAQIVNATAGAVFAQATWEFADNWKLTVGGRQSYEEKDVRVRASTLPYVGATITPGIPYSDSESWTNFTPKATLEYQLGKNMFYATYAKGFKSGGFSYAAAGDPIPLVLKPEVLNMFEVGAKGRLFDDAVRYDLPFLREDCAGPRTSQSYCPG